MTFKQYLFATLPGNLPNEVWQAITTHQLRKCSEAERQFVEELIRDYYVKYPMSLGYQPTHM